MPMIRVAHSIAGLLLVAALGACVDATPRPDEEDPDLAARALLAEGRFVEAAAEYLRLAEQAQDEALWRFTLNAADALMADSRPEEALARLESGDWAGASAAQRTKRAALRAELVLARGDPEQALALLSDAVLSGAPASMAHGMRRTRARAFLARGDYLQAAREGSALEGPGLAAEAARDNRRFIWNALGALTPAELDAARTPPPSRFGGWIELAALHRALRFDHARFKTALGSWEAHFPAHPAGVELVPELLAQSLADSKPPAKVALLLPLRGAFAEAARAVRDGFFAAWYQGGNEGDRPVIIVRDTSDTGIAPLVRSSMEEGAEFIVGPLRKSSVNEAAGLGRLAVPMLALNRVTDDTAVSPLQDLYQFALSPEDEAGQVAERAWSEGYTRAAVLAPASEWGSRVAEAFSSTWEQLGGRVAEAQYYASEHDESAQPPDLSAPVEKLFNIDESKGRRDALGRVLGERLHFEPHRRTDVDVVFMAGFPREVRQLRPQIEFHHAGAVPIYSTSHVYTGVPNAGADSDLDDVVFGDMPMVLPASRDAEQVRRRLYTLWPGRLRAYARLYAFGLDAFALVTRLRHLEAAPERVHAGHTGLLRLDETRRVRRHLRFARFEHGLPRPVDRRASFP